MRSTIRLFFARFSIISCPNSSVWGALGKGCVSAYPDALRLEGSYPRLTRNLTTSEALATESSQLEGNLSVLIGTLSVCPSISTLKL